MDYYESLGVNRNASAKEIKSAFRKKAAEHHPDKGGDPNQFKQINEAYQTLSNNEKRSMYDQFGTADPQQANMNRGGTQFHFNMGGNGFEEVFSSFFGDGFANPNSPFRQRQMRNQDITIAADITLHDIVNGKELIATFRLPSGKEQTVTIKVPKGVRPGDTMRYNGMGGDNIPQAPRGDLFVKIRGKKDPEYHVDGINLYIERTINVFDLILGTNIRVDTLHGRSLSVTVPPGSNPGTTFSISGQGLPDQRSGVTGSLFVKVNAITPKIYDEKTREKIAKIKDETDLSS